MTAKHLVDGVMQWTSSRTYNSCASLLGIESATVYRMSNGDQRSLNMATVDLIQQRSGVPIETLFAWYRLPKDAVLGRIDVVQP
jgi:hypothetical protein